MSLRNYLFIVVLFCSQLAFASPKDSAYTYRFSVENHLGHPYLNFQLDSSWYFVKEYYRHAHFVYNEFVNPSLKEELNIIQLAADFSIAEAGKTKIPSNMLALNFKQVVKQFQSADYEQKMGYVQLDILHKKAILNLKMLGIGKGFLLVYELDDQSTWMMWYPNLRDLKKSQLNARIANADKMILESFVPVDKMDPSENKLSDDTSFVDAEFKGGYEGLSKFVHENLTVPDSFLNDESSNNEGTSSRVIIRFIVDVEGAINDFYIENLDAQLLPSLVNVSIELYRQMPNWIPAREQGKPIKIYLRLPLKFMLF